MSKALAYFMLLPAVGVSILTPEEFMESTRDPRSGPTPSLHGVQPFPRGDGNHALFYSPCVTPFPTSFKMSSEHLDHNQGQDHRTRLDHYLHVEQQRVWDVQLTFSTSVK